MKFEVVAGKPVITLDNQYEIDYIQQLVGEVMFIDEEHFADYLAYQREDVLEFSQDLYQNLRPYESEASRSAELFHISFNHDNL